jgi:eukaryotic-like serine/threonine-protein kinase
MHAALSHYRILEQIGAGGMGVVYRAHDERLDRDVALKVLPPGIVVEPAARKRFRKEALMLSKLNHANIATVHDFDTEDGTDFLVEEFIDGLSLDAMVGAGPLSETEIINLGSQLAEGLAAAHDHGVIHRDLKPANLRITSEARLKILDFGLADILRGEVTPDAVTLSQSETRAIVGTLPYMAPEQLLKRKFDVRTDIWAAGCVLFEMATGSRPFLGSGPALTDAIVHQPATSASKLNPRISGGLDAVIQKCLEKDPEKRYSSAREIAVDLRRASIPLQTQLRIRWRAAASPRIRLTAVAVLLVACATLWAVWPGRNSLLALWKNNTVSKASSTSVPHESYLAGMKDLERWDRPKSLESAERNFQQSVNADPSFALGFSALAEVYWARYRLDHDSRWIDQAEKNCRKAAELNRELPAVYATLARIHNGRGQYNLALEEIQRAEDLAPRDPEAMLTQAAIFAEIGQDEKAESLYMTAAALRPENWDGFYEFGAFYYRRGRNAEAAEKFKTALSITPDNALVHAALGGVLQLTAQYSQAEAHLKRSIDLQPSYAAYTNLGAFYLRRKRWEDAASATRKALGINASDWHAWSNLGLACEWLNRKQEADTAYREEQLRLEALLKVRGDDPELQAELGLLYSRQGLREKALPLIEAARVGSADDPNILSTVAEAYENFGDRSTALDLVKKALALGWTLEQLENVPNFRKLLVDSRFREITRDLANHSNPARQQP